MILNILNKIQAKFFKVVNYFINNSLALSEELFLQGDGNEH